MQHRPRNSVSNRTRRAAVATVAGGALLVIAAAPVGSLGARVTSGDVRAFAAAEGGEVAIGGHAQMVRTANGTTKVSIHVTGLEPGATYGSHVHEGSCAANETGGGHYFFDAPVGGGDGPGADEIWPGPVVANGGGVANGKARVDATAGEEASSVVVHRHTGEKIACADLG